MSYLISLTNSPLFVLEGSGMYRMSNVAVENQNRMRHFSGSELDYGDKDTVQSNIEMPVGIGLALGTKHYVQVRIENISNWLQSSAYGPDLCQPCTQTSGEKLQKNLKIFILTSL